MAQKRKLLQWRKPVTDAVLCGRTRLCTLVILGAVLSGCIYNYKPAPEGILATPGSAIHAEDGSFRIVADQPFKAPFGVPCAYEPRTRNFDYGEALGARRVRVTVPGLSSPLYGVLALCHIHPAASGPATESLQIEIPEPYVKATEGGRVSVVFEYIDEGSYAWILWLSRDPLPKS